MPESNLPLVWERRMNPGTCPICGIKFVEQIPNSEQILVDELIQRGRFPAVKLGVQGYRCGNGHLMLVYPKGSKPNESSSSKKFGRAA
jgi:hypothetical protein